MAMKGWAITMCIGAAAGAVATMMLPRQSTARRLVTKAADKVDDAYHHVACKIQRELDM